MYGSRRSGTPIAPPMARPVIARIIFSQGALDGFIGEVSLLRLPDKDSIGLGDLTVYEEMTTGAEILEDS